MTDDNKENLYRGQCWWLTGASSGIGASLARALAGRGASLVLSGRNFAALEAVARDCGDTLLLPFEATDYANISAVAERAWSWQGRIDALVNNAGISQRSLAVATDFAVYQKIIAVDLLAPIALTQAVLPRMVAAGGGRIVAISSVAGLLGAPMRSAYSAAKHGLIGYHDAVRAENEHLGIKVHVVAPGSVKTDVSRNALLGDGTRRGISDAEIENGLSPDVLAEAMLAGIEAGKRELIIASDAQQEIAMLRRHDPEALFDRMSAAVQGGYARKLESEFGER